MPEEQMAEEEEDEDDEMDEEYTPEMADELMRRGLILGGGLVSMPSVFRLNVKRLPVMCVCKQASMYPIFLLLWMSLVCQPCSHLLCHSTVNCQLPYCSSVCETQSMCQWYAASHHVISLLTLLMWYADNTEEYDSEGSESDEDEENRAGLNSIYAGGDSDDDEEESDDSDEADDGFVHRSSVIIEEVKDGEHDVAQITTTIAAKVSQAQ